MMIRMVTMDMLSSYGSRLPAATSSGGRKLPVGLRPTRLDPSSRGDTRPDEQNEADQDADDAERVVHEHGKNDPDDDE